MMRRQPSDRVAAWAFWRGVLAGEITSVPMEPQCGFYRMKVNGRSVPVSIDLEQQTDDAGDLIADEAMVCLVNGRPWRADDVWDRCAGNPITEEEFDRLRRAPVVTDLTRQVVV